MLEICIYISMCSGGFFFCPLSRAPHCGSVCSALGVPLLLRYLAHVLSRQIWWLVYLLVVPVLLPLYTYLFRFACFIAFYFSWPYFIFFATYFPFSIGLALSYTFTQLTRQTGSTMGVLFLPTLLFLVDFYDLCVGFLHSSCHAVQWVICWCVLPHKLLHS